MTDEPNSARRPYSSPELRSLGTITEMTQAAGPGPGSVDNPYVCYVTDGITLPGSGGSSPSCEG